MRGCLRLDRWGGQFTVLLIAAREFLGCEQRRNAATAGQGESAKPGSARSSASRVSGPPTWMRPAHLHDGIMHARGKSAQRSARGAAHVRGEADVPLMLTEASPFAYRPD